MRPLCAPMPELACPQRPMQRSDEALLASRLDHVDNAELCAIQVDPSVGLPFSNDVQAIFTDFYQITMMYAYWKAGKHLEDAVFDVTFRNCPFTGEFAVFAGASEVIRFVNSLRFTPSQLEYLRYRQTC